MSAQLDAAVKALRGYKAVLPHDWRIVLNHLIEEGIVHWPTEPRIISNFPELADLPRNSIIRAGNGVAYQRGPDDWWQAGEDRPVDLDEIPLPAEVLA